MIDLVKLLLKAGDGGHGRVSFRREKYVPKGGPDGGNGGVGGSIVLRATEGVSTLHHYAGAKKFVAQSGQMGGKKKQTGADGENLVLEVPVGTVVWLLDENQASHQRRTFPAREGHVYAQQLDRYYVEKEGQPVPDRPNDQVETTLQDISLKNIDLKAVSKEHLAELHHPGQEVVICTGGRGGRGNTAFKSPSNTTPLEAEYGGFGGQKLVLLELKLLADVGLVGLPNAGKSTLLSVLSAARPEIGAYPFTTLEPNLGVVDVAAAGQPPQTVVMADIPGIIEAAHAGKGLGFEFLRHIERCRVLVFVLALSEEDVFAAEASVDTLWEQLQQQLNTLQSELASYDRELSEKPALIVVNKTDLYPAELIERVAAQGWGVLSAATQQGVEELQQQLRHQLAEQASS